MNKLKGFLSRLGDGWVKDPEDEFMFIDPGPLVDDDLELVLVDKRSGNPHRGYMPVYMFHMRVAGQKTAIGQLSLRIGSTEHLEMYAGHIGYIVEPEYRGRRFAARSCQLVFPLALQHDLNPVWITCNPDNRPSRRTCEIVGGVLTEIVPIPKNNPLYASDTKFKCRYRVDL